MASPGVPDYYQGTELYDFSLVDPDNRRPVDYRLRRKLLDEAESDPARLLSNLPDGRAKMHVIRRGLGVRRAHANLFHGGRYVALHADAGREENIAAFALQRDARAVIAVAPRLFAGLVGEEAAAPIGERVWGEAALRVPDELRGEYSDAITERQARPGGEAAARPAPRPLPGRPARQGLKSCATVGIAAERSTHAIASPELTSPSSMTEQ